jgi:hypothetical protein
MREISAQALRSCLVDGGELAVLDAREEGEFGLSHLFWATSCSLSQVETRAPRLLPGRSVRIVCVDDSRGDPPDDDCIDACLRPYERNSGVEEAMKVYLSWETGLIEQIKQDDTVEFNSGGPGVRPAR